MSRPRIVLRHSNRLLRLRQTRAFSAAHTRRADAVRVVEVGPRDGLQNEKVKINLDTKTELIHRLSSVGLTNIEAGAFVSPKWIPQMADSSQILERLVTARPPSSYPIAYSFLVPNSRGMNDAISVYQNAVKSFKSDSSRQSSSESGVSTEPGRLDEVAIFAAATESFSRKNINCSIVESLDRFRPVIDIAKQNGIRVRGYLSVVLGCPYEGPNVSPAKVAGLTRTLLEMGADEVSLGDTIGTGTPDQTGQLLRNIKAASIPSEKIAMHFHDTFKHALLNTSVSLDAGIRVFDSSVGGLGGCPFAKGATGNVATEDMVQFLHSSGLQTGIDLAELSKIGRWICEKLGKAYATDYKAQGDRNVRSDVRAKL